MTLRDKVHGSENRTGLNVEPNREIPATLVRARDQNVPGKIGEASLGGYRTSGQEVDQGPSGVITSPTLLGPVLVWSQQSCQRLLKTMKYFETLPIEKAPVILK